MSAPQIRWTCFGPIRRSCERSHLSPGAAQACCARDHWHQIRAGGAGSDRKPMIIAQGKTIAPAEYIRGAQRG